MLGIVTVTHGEFSQGLHHAAEMIMGKQDAFNAVSLHEGMDLELFSSEVSEAICSADTGSGVLVFVDMFGATPFNTVGRNLQGLRESGIQLKIITGVNLPMLMEAIAMRSTSSLDELQKTIGQTGKDAIETVAL